MNFQFILSFIQIIKKPNKALKDTSYTVKSSLLITIKFQWKQQKALTLVKLLCLIRKMFTLNINQQKITNLKYKQSLTGNKKIYIRKCFEYISVIFI